MIPAIDVTMATGFGHASDTAVTTRHSPDVEMRAIWHPVVTVRTGDDLTLLLQRRRMFTVVKDSG